MINFYRRFLPNAVQHHALFNGYLVGAKKSDKRKIDWTPEAIESFNFSKQQLFDAAVLAFPNMDAPLAIFVDASDIAIGAALQQFVKGHWQPLGFFSKKLNQAQRNYCTYDRELLAVCLLG